MTNYLLADADRAVNAKVGEGGEIQKDQNILMLEIELMRVGVGR